MALFGYLNRHILDIPSYVALAVLGAVLVLQFARRSLVRRHTSRVFLYASSFFAAYLLYVTLLQFIAFRSGVLGAILGRRDVFLWFLGYVRLHYWNEYIVSFVVALLFVWVAGYCNRKFNERFFEHEERYLGALGIFLVGYPGCLFYVAGMLVVPALASLLFVPREERLPFYYFWMPIAILAVSVVHFWAREQVWWNTFRF